MGVLAYIIWLIIQSKSFVRTNKVKATAIILGILLVMWLGILSIIVYLYGEYDQTNDNFQPVDVMIVLGAGLERNGSAGKALSRRSEKAAELYHQGVAVNVICTGGIGQGQTKSEASVCKELLIEYGVPPNVIFLEEQSGSTEENVIYSKEILDSQNWDKVLIVTDSFHVLRASLIFDKYDIEYYRSPVPFSWIGKVWYFRLGTRELAAIHWYIFKEILGLDVTNI